MSELDKAIARLAGAVDTLEEAIGKMDQGADIWGEMTTEDGTPVPVIVAERNELASEVRSLRERAEKDAVLRAEAADAVRQALTDLRGAVGKERANA